MSGLYQPDTNWDMEIQAGVNVCKSHEVNAATGTYYCQSRGIESFLNRIEITSYDKVIGAKNCTAQEHK